jgi:polysaccharide pyruvyl transferase WcaK-like protein
VNSARRAMGAPVHGSPKVGLFGLLGQGNLGNDGSMESVLAYLKAEHPEAVLDALGSDAATLTDRYGIPAANLRWYVPGRRMSRGTPAIAGRAVGLGAGVVMDAWRISAWVRRHDSVIVPGMGVLETTVPMRPWKTPYWMFLLCVSGRLSGTRVGLISVGANVTHRRVTRWLITTAVRAAHYRSFRDEVSKDAMREMGVDTSSDVVYPDVAFLLPTPVDVESVPKSVGLGIMDYSGNDEEIAIQDQLRANYIKQVKLFTRWLLDSGHPVRLFTSDTADEPVVAEIAQDAREYRPELPASWIVAEPAETLAELMTQIAPVDTVVATRYHNVLYALLQTKPTLALAYATKHEHLVADTGLPGFFLPCRSLDVRQMIEKFTELERRSGELRQEIAKRKSAKVRLVTEQLTAMSAVLFPWKSTKAAIFQDNPTYSAVPSMSPQGE